MAEARTKPRVGNFSAGLLICIAVFFDVVQFLLSFLHVVPVAGNALAFVLVLFVTVIAYISLGLWFAMLGVNYFTGKRAALKVLTVLASLGIELIPLVDALPAITAGTVVMVLVSRLEDATGLKAKQMTSANLGAKRAQTLAALASTATPLGRARAFAQLANRQLETNSIRTPEDEDLINQESEGAERERNERARKDEEKNAEYKRFRQELSGFRTDTRRFTQENIDPSFYGIKREDRQQQYRQWRSEKAGVLSKTRGKTIDIERNEPKPSSYRE